MISSRALKKKLSVKRLIPVLTTLTILFLLFTNIGVDKILAGLHNLRIVYVLYAFAMSLLFSILSAQKWRILLEMTGHKTDFLRCPKIVMATHASNILLPAKAGDFLKSWALRDEIPVSRGVGIVLVERLIDVFILCTMAVIGSLVVKDGKLIVLSSIVSALCVLSVVALRIVGGLRIETRFAEQVKHVGWAATLLFQRPRYAILVMTLSGIIMFGSVFQTYLLYLSVQQHIPFTYVVSVLPIVILIGLIPVTIGGMGTRDAAFVYLFSPYSSSSASITVGLFFSLLRYWLLGLLGIPFMGSLATPSDETSDPSEKE